MFRVVEFVTVHENAFGHDHRAEIIYTALLHSTSPLHLYTYSVLVQLRDIGAPTRYKQQHRTYRAADTAQQQAILYIHLRFTQR